MHVLTPVSEDTLSSEQLLHQLNLESQQADHCKGKTDASKHRESSVDEHELVLLSQRTSQLNKKTFVSLLDRESCFF